MKAQEQIRNIQQILKDGGFYTGEIDGLSGKKTHAAFDECAQAALDDYHASKENAETDQALEEGVHNVKASSFADPADVRAFRKCKAEGGSDNFCFSKGDNGIGLWGDDTTAPKPMCALPPEDWLEKWGSKAAARGKAVIVHANGRRVTCELRDTMPHRKNIKNGAGIDLNPAAAAALGLRPPFMIAATWQWA